MSETYEAACNTLLQINVFHLGVMTLVKKPPCNV